jgi:replicative superfamily II helicase
MARKSSALIAAEARIEMLESLNEAKEAQLVKAREVYAAMHAEIERLKAQPARIARPDNSAILKRMAEAKAQAMATGKTVTV